MVRIWSPMSCERMRLERHPPGQECIHPIFMYIRQLWTLSREYTLSRVSGSLPRGLTEKSDLYGFQSCARKNAIEEYVYCQTLRKVSLGVIRPQTSSPSSEWESVLRADNGELACTLPLFVSSTNTPWAYLSVQTRRRFLRLVRVLVT